MAVLALLIFAKLDVSGFIIVVLGTLAALERALSKVRGRDLVFWIDDAHNHLDRGLTRDNLRRLVERYPQAIIAVTIHSARLDAIKDFDRELHRLMLQPFDELLLEARLDPARPTDGAPGYSGTMFRAAGRLLQWV